MTNPSAPPTRHGATSASQWVKTYLPPASPGATVLDVACGSGRHLQLALQRGYAVTGVDRTSDARSTFQNLTGITIRTCDLETDQSWPFAGQTFQAVIVTNYLYRPRLPDVVACVAADGILIYETFAVGNERFGRPSNPAFLLQPGELLVVVQDRLTPIAYQHVTLSNPTRIVQRIAAVGATHSWFANPPSTDLSA